jgi:hypothetical protein
METETNTVNKSVCIEIFFNEGMDDGEVQDFLDRALSKYKHPDDVVSSYDYWY